MGSERSSTCSTSDGCFELDTNGWAQKHAIQERAEISNTSKNSRPWWMKVKIKKPFGPMQITAMKTVENSGLADVNLGDSENRHGSDDYFNSISNESYGRPRDISE